MLRKLTKLTSKQTKKTRPISLEQVSKNEWRFISDKSLNKIMDYFYDACEEMDIGNYENAAIVFQQIIEEIPEFIDAYTHLAIIMASLEKEETAVSILEHGIEKSLALFPKNFFDNKNILEWGWHENRPFLRCYANLGLTYLDEKKFKEAKIIFDRIIAMNPNDNQGIRDPLLNCNLKLENFDDALNLCNSYPDDMLPSTNYGKALVLFKLKKLPEAEEQFILAVKRAPRVAKELLKTKHIKPKDYGMGPGVIVGGQEEAYDYWLSYGQLWKSTPGTIPFIKNCLTKASKIKAVYDETD